MLNATAVAAAAAAAALGTLAYGSFVPNSRLLGPVVGRGLPERALYLTFDDGPNPRATEPIIRLLERERIAATFFMVGRHVERYASVAHAVSAAGFGIGNHTQTHRKLAWCGPRRTADEVQRAHDAIVVGTGRAPTCFRAPHGYRNPFLARCLAPYGYRVIGWSLGVWDTAKPGPATIRERVRRGLSPGTILLLHDGDGYDPEGDRGQTVAALPGILDDCRARGYEFRGLETLGSP